MFSKLKWQSVAGAALILLTLILIAKADYSHLVWAENLSKEGSPAPEFDANSPTGYENQQRHLLSTARRGETYRWIAYAQSLAENGFFQEENYTRDTVPTGRPQLLPKLYAGWLLFVAALVQLFTGVPFPLAIEKTALWEPIASHVAIFALFAASFIRRFGFPQAALAGCLFALFPFFSAQFAPGSLSPDTWALFLAAFAVLASFPVKGEPSQPIRVRTATLAGLALWLNPAFGFPAALILATAGTAIVQLEQRALPFLKWAGVGAAIGALGCWIDQNPWDSSASELRYLHPLYAIAWFGLGTALKGFQDWRLKRAKPLRSLGMVALGTSLWAWLAFVQISGNHLGWLYSGAELLRPASLDASQVFTNAFQWIGASSAAEGLFLFLLPLLAVGITIYNLLKTEADKRIGTLVSLLLLLAVVLLSALKIRWGVVLALLAIPVIWSQILSLRRDRQRYALIALTPLLFVYFAWGKNLPSSLKLPGGEDLLSARDLEALAYRHTAHWMTTHYPTWTVNALASPELSDSLIFHGNSNVLLSTAWESYPGQVAAARVLSAPESSEVQAVLESREITHLLLPSWDKVLPLLVQAPKDAEDTTFYDRAQRWLLPLFLRPVPYHLPPAPGFEAEKLALYEMTPPQDDALSLSRLAEYFVEMRRPEPALLAANSLTDAYPQDPNAQIAKAFVFTDTNDALEFRKQLMELADDVEAGLVPLDWDRRVLRAITLAVGKKHDLAKPEVEACLESMSEEGLYALTPLQTFQFLRLVATYKLTLSDDSLRELALARCAEYLPRK